MPDHRPYALLVTREIARQRCHGRDLRSVDDAQRHILLFERRSDPLQGREVVGREGCASVPYAELPESAVGEVLHLLDLGIGVGSFGVGENADVQADARIDAEDFGKLVVQDPDVPVVSVRRDTQRLGRFDGRNGFDALALGEARRQRGRIDHQSGDMIFSCQFLGDVPVGADEFQRLH